LTDLLFITMALYGDSLDELNGYQTMKHHWTWIFSVLKPKLVMIT
jgi:hypothetical protein